MEQNYPENLDQNLLQDYYQALDAINTQHLKLLDAQRELSWHNSRKQEADKLARELGCNDILSLANAENINYQTTDRSRVEKYFTNAAKIVDTWKNLVDSNHKNIYYQNKCLEDMINIKLRQLQDVKRQFQETKSQEIKRTQQKSTLEELEKEKAKTAISLLQISQDLEDLKIKKMWYLLSTVLVAIVSTFVGKNLLITIIATSVYFILLWQGMGKDK